MAEIHPSAIVYPGTVLGEGVRVLENAVVGKQPSLGASSTARREPLPPTTVGDGTVISTGAIVFAGSAIGANCIVGDQSCIRERVAMADDCILGRGSLIEPGDGGVRRAQVRIDRAERRRLAADGHSEQLKLTLERALQLARHGGQRSPPVIGVLFTRVGLGCRQAVADVRYAAQRFA